MSDNKQLKFMQADSLEDFKNMYIAYYKQELALKDGLSYFDVTTSNMDGTFVGEEFDNPIRIKALRDNNKEFLKQVNEDELMKIVHEEYQKDLNDYKNEN